MEWVTDPGVWVGLVTLVALEVAAMDGLGIKQLVARRAGTAGTA